MDCDCRTSQFECRKLQLYRCEYMGVRMSNPRTWRSELRLKNDNCIDTNIQNVCVQSMHVRHVSSELGLKTDNCIGINIQNMRKSASNPRSVSSELRHKTNDNCVGANIQKGCVNSI